MVSRCDYVFCNNGDTMFGNALMSIAGAANPNIRCASLQVRIEAFLFLSQTTNII